MTQCPKSVRNEGILKSGQACQRASISAIDREGFPVQFAAVVERLAEGTLSRQKSAQELHIGYATLKRLIDAHPASGQQPGQCATTLAAKEGY